MLAPLQREERPFSWAMLEKEKSELIANQLSSVFKPFIDFTNIEHNTLVLYTLEKIKEKIKATCYDLITVEAPQQMPRKESSCISDIS